MDTGWLSAHTESLDVQDTQWVNTGTGSPIWTCQFSVESPAPVVAGNMNLSNYLANLPVGATIVGLEFKLEANAILVSGDGDGRYIYISDGYLYVFDGATQYTITKPFNFGGDPSLPLVATVTTFGGPTDLLGLDTEMGHAPTVDQLNDARLQYVLGASMASGSGAATMMANIWDFGLKIYYTGGTAPAAAPHREPAAYQPLMRY